MPALPKDNIPAIPERHNQDYNLLEAEALDIPVLQRRLGGVALEGIRINARHNHDSLAHVSQLARDGVLSTDLVTKFKTEFIPDIGERSPDMGFYHMFTMRLEDNDIISATGVSMKSSIADSVRATEHDVQHDTRRSYGLLREQVQQQQIDQIVDWACSQGTIGFYGFASLCPGEGEVTAQVAKINGFKPERQMASLWLYEKSYAGLTMHALSLDHCTPERFQRLLNVCQIEHNVKSSTMEQLGNPISFTYVDVDDMKLMWQEILEHDGLDTKSIENEANSLVDSHPEAFQLYMKFVVDVAASLARASVNKNLSGLLREARKSTGSENSKILTLRRFRRFNENDARDLMDFVRSRMIPHYIYSPHDSKHSEGGVSAVLGSSGAAASRVGSYDGACPASTFESQPVELSAMASTGLINRQLVVDKLMSKNQRGSCLTCGTVQTTVYGCGLCTKCNKVWCDEYKSSGKGLGLKEITRIVTKKPVTKKPHKKSKQVN